MESSLGRICLLLDQVCLGVKVELQLLSLSLVPWEENQLLLHHRPILKHQQLCIKEAQLLLYL